MASKSASKGYGSGSGYGKRPLWQWVLIYLVIGGVIYFAVYYLFFANKGGYSYNADQTTQQSSPYNYNQ